MTSGKNFSNQDTPSIVDTEYEHCNFTHTDPVDVGGGVFEGVRLFPGDDTPRTFTECNLVNCHPPPGSTLVRCNTTVVQYHLFDYTDTITIDGASDTVDHYKTRIYGRLDPDTLTYEYEPTPIDDPED